MGQEQVAPAGAGRKRRRRIERLDVGTIAWIVHNEPARRADIWFVDVASGRHTSWLAEADHRSWPRDPRWSPDGRSLAYTME